jgi:hypothetical protein
MTCPSRPVLSDNLRQIYLLSDFDFFAAFRVNPLYFKKVTSTRLASRTSLPYYPLMLNLAPATVSALEALKGSPTLFVVLVVSLALILRLPAIMREARQWHVSIRSLPKAKAKRTMTAGKV